jgi:diguanylate cyclase (GGDEF)-like protein
VHPCARDEGICLSFSPFELLLYVSITLMAFGLGGRVAGRRSAERLARSENARDHLQQRADSQRQRANELERRLQNSEEMVQKLQRSVREMPEVAQRLTATRDLREIPHRTLEMVMEIFDPTYAVFYRMVREELVAVAALGDSEFGVGHRVAMGEGIVGWTASKQLPYTPEDAKFESGIVKERHLAKGVPENGFSVCLPIMSGERTIGVILVGPSQRDLPHMPEIGRTIALIASVTITSALVLKQQRMLAKTDGLTGLLNKTHTLSRLRDLIASDGGTRVVSLFIFDIDHFKHYNDTNGHLPGDELLKDLSVLLKETSREDELVGRYGGEEFLLVMPGTAKSEGLSAAERIRCMIAEHDFPFGETQPLGRVTVSGGLATWPHDGDDVDTLIRAADEALYQAKREGRNRVFAYTQPELALDSDDGVTEIRELQTRENLDELEKIE